MIERPISFTICLILLEILLLTKVSAQILSSGLITGRVIDTETTHPLENVIVFIPNTPFGSSSRIDGTFRVTDIPAGEYELVFSRVGYERQNIPIKIQKSDSLYYEIKLQQQPVKTGEVEVIGERPEGGNLKTQGLFFPKESPDIYCIYGTVSSLPIGIFFSDSAFYMYSLETAIIDSEKYVRLWLLYQNLSQTPYDLNPMKCVKMHMKGRKYSYNDIPPAPPMMVHTMVDTEQIIARISETIGQSLRKMAVLRAEFTGQLEPFDEWAKATSGSQRPIRWRLDVPPADDGTLSPRLYKIFRNSVSVGIMQRYTVFPNNGVNGYIYFPFPGINWKASKAGFHEALEYNYQIEIVTQSGSKIIEFIPG